VTFSQVLQGILAIVAVAGFVVLYRRSRPAALALMWLSWIFMPLARRLIEYAAGTTERDLLSLVPFLLTGMAGVAAIRGARPTGPMLAILAIGAAAFLVGVPAGLAQPMALAFALLAYGAPMAAAFIGAREGRSTSDPPLGSLGSSLLLALPFVAAYGIVQYYALPLLPWDVSWIAAADMRSLRSPEPDHLRVFSTLNSPFPAAAAVGVALLVWVGRARLGITDVVAGALGVAVLALTFVRSSWVGLAVAGVVLLIAGRSRVVLTRAVVGGAVLALVLFAGLGHPTIQAVIQRGSSISDYERDPSAQDRFGLVEEVVPQVTSPGGLLGHGLGQAGLASGLGGSSPLASADNGYLAILYQSGPIGFALLLVALTALVALAIRSVRRGDPAAPLDLALLVFTLVIEFFNDALYGMRGAVLWYVAGRVIANAFAGEHEWRFSWRERSDTTGSTAVTRT
jgi:hypothetical protein